MILEVDNMCHVLHNTNDQSTFGYDVYKKKHWQVLGCVVRLVGIAVAYVV